MFKKTQPKIHTYKEYRDKYGKKFDNGKLEFVSFKDVDKLNRKKKYWKIEDEKPGYYEISDKTPLFLLLLILGVAGLVAAIVVPSVLLTRTPPLEEFCKFTFNGEHSQIEVDGKKSYQVDISFKKDEKPNDIYHVYADSNFELPIELESPGIITYTRIDAGNATISFNSKISQDIILKIEANPIIEKVDFTVSGDGCKIIVGQETKTGHTFTYTKGSKPTDSISLKADDAYSFPESQINLPGFLKYVKVDDTNATLSFIDVISDTINVTIKAEQQTSDFSFTFSGTDCTLNNESSYPANTELNLTLTPKSSAFDVPEHIAVKINDVIQTEGEDYTYMPNDTSASLSLTITGDVKVEALAREKDLAITLKIKPTVADNMLGFAFQCTPKGEAPNPEVDKIIVDWGDNTPTSTIAAPTCIDNDIIQIGGMYQYIGSGMQGSFPTTSDFQRHTYSDLSSMPEDGFTVKFYGDINNIAFGFPHPSPAYKTTVVPWGTANKHITSITTYCDLPAVHINSTAGSSQGIDFDTYVIFSNEEEFKSVNFALGTTTIPNGCCSKAGGLTTVEIPETVTKIGDQAFWISGLQEATIPDSVTLIGEQAFCEAHLGNGVHFGPNSQLEEIAKSAFQACEYKEFSLPDSVTTVGEMAFRESDTLKTFNISPNSQLEIIDSQTFSDDNALEKIYIPKSVTSIANNAFDECDLLSEVDLSDAKFTSIGDYAFKNCPKLKAFNLPTTVTTIGFQAFYKCTGISEIVITNAVETINGEAFFFWSNTQSIYFPDCADLDAIIARYGETTEWATQATIKPGEKPAAM